MPTDVVSADRVRRVAVLGAGTMGSGIAQVAAVAGFEVRLRDIETAFIEKGLASIRDSLAKAVSKGKLAADERERALARIQTTTDTGDAVREADLVIEAIPEDLALKQETFRFLGETCREDALLATNTSSLSVTAIASAARSPGRVLGMHFFNPPPIMKLLEIVRGEKTEDGAVETARSVGARLGKESIVVKDSPGFASSRLGIALAMEAIRMLESGVASAEDIDRAMELGYAHPMGPLKLTDLVGLDIRLAIAEHLHREIGEAFRPPQLLKRMVRAGKFGKKSGEGFYRYP